MEDKLKYLSVLNDNDKKTNTDPLISKKEKKKSSKSKLKRSKKSVTPSKADEVFKDEYKSLCKKLESIKGKLKELDKISILKIESIAKNTKFSDDKFSSLKSEIGVSVNDFHSRLLALSELVSKSEFESDPSSFRMKKMLIASLSQEFRDLYNEYEEVQKQTSEQYNRIVRHQLKVMNPEVELSEDQQPSELVLSQLISDSLTEEGLRVIHDRHQMLKAVERDLIEIQQLYIGIAELVEIQGEKIDSIENYIDMTKASTESGLKDLKKAYKHKKRARKKKVLIVSLVVGAFVSLGAIFSGVFAR